MPILNGITCAVVGVIANLAIFFAIHTLFPDGLNPNVSFEHLIFALSIMVMASIAIIKYGQSIMRVLMICGLFGIFAHYFNVH